MKKIKDFLEENEINFMGTLLLEMAMSPSRMSDKYGEVIGSIVDNLVSICLYPDNPTVPHWRERAHGLCKRFIDIDITPANKNTYQQRLKCLTSGVIEELDNDYGAILRHFKSVSIYYSKRPNKHDILTPYKPYEQAYRENKERVQNGIIKLTDCIAKQDYVGAIDFMEIF